MTSSKQSSPSYWEERRQSLLANMEKDEDRLNAQLAKTYASERAKLEKEIASYYAKYGEDNVLEYRKLLGSLSESDRTLLIERMEDFGKKYPQYAHLMPVRASVYKLNELEGLQYSIMMQQLEIGAIEQEQVRAYLEKQALRSANLAAEQMGFGDAFYTVDSSVIKATVGAAWAQEKDFSERIWTNRQNLASYLNDDFGKLIARGVTYQECAKAIGERFENVSTRNIKRLVYTEATFVFNEAHAQAHEQDFEYYRLSCADSRACAVCKDIAAQQKAKPAKFSERKPGANFPPLHSWCRCSYEVADDLGAWLAKKAEESHDASRTLSTYDPDYDKEPTVQTSSSFASAADIAALEEMVEGKYGAMMHGVDGLDFESVRAMCCGIDDVLSDFGITDVLSTVKGRNLGTKTIADTGMSGTVCINDRFFGKRYDGALSSGWHEAAHLIEVYKSKDDKEFAEASWARRILTRALKKMNAESGTKSKLEKAIDGVSSYPAIAAFESGDKALLYSEGVAKTIEIHYNGLGDKSPFIRYIMDEVRKDVR